MSIEKLQEKIRLLKNPTVMDMSFDPAIFPEAICREKRTDPERYHVYAKQILKELAGIVPAVRFRLGSFMLLGSFGIEAMRDMAEYAQYLGYYIFMDVPHASSAREAQIAAEYMLRKDTPYTFDCLILNPYIGSDGLKPYIPLLNDSGKSVFLILRTANRSAFELQDLLAGSRLVHAAAAECAVNLGKPLLHRCGYSQVGGVAAANSQDTLIKLRRSHKNLFFLLDGYDEQGGCAKKCTPAFDVFGHGAVVCAGESILGAWRDHPGEEEQYIAHAVEAAKRMRGNLTRYVKIL